MSDLNINNITDRTGDSGPVIAGVSTVSSTGSFTVPVGPTEMRGGRGRGIFSGGYKQTSPNTGDVNHIEFIEIATTGNSTDFGDLTNARRGQGGSCASSTRYVQIGGRDSPLSETTIDYVIFSSGGGASEFGDSINGVSNAGSASDSTRGICHSGVRGNPSPATSPLIDFITLASTGNTSDFGDASVQRFTHAGTSSPTRGVFAGGYNPVELGSIEYLTIQSKGNGIDFGNLTATRRRAAGGSNTTRAIFAGGMRYPSSPNGVDIIDYITIASTGDAIDFGNLSSSNAASTAGGNTSATRCVMNYTQTSTPLNTLDYVTIATTGNAADFGDLQTSGVWGRGSRSDSHGGLG